MEQIKINGQVVSLNKYNYGNYSSDNYGANSICVQLGNKSIYYSYDTVVAFEGTNSKGVRFGLTVSENCWGPTTGKHLNWIDGGRKDKRLNRDEFLRKLSEFLE